MKKTEHLLLNKPDADDFYSVEDFNENSDILDEYLHPRRVLEAFKKFFTYFEEDILDQTDPTAMTMDDVTNAINREWDGSSSQDATAMSTDEISNALETTWDGSSSTDPEAMSREEIEIAIQNGEMI